MPVAAAGGHRQAPGPWTLEAVAALSVTGSGALSHPTLAPHPCPHRAGPAHRRTLACQGLARACLPSPRNPGGPAS
ncbi:hypothetical protein P7K49_026546 [Saguinus oedipus]|uniref:Uncharacterized protein n=1 Tax=Saguinus oedipus TaxID=9490 RepID=A0ABQ9UEE7_SAGOE|nr:hypothetical protein P7K49_026546 [Saguinus oedipus]